MTRIIDFDLRIASNVFRRLLVVLAAVIGGLGPIAMGQDDAAPAEPTVAEAPPVVVPAAFESPEATLRTFLTAMEAEERSRAAECLDLSDVEKEGAADRAQELYFCINRIEYVDFDGDASIRDANAANIGDATTWQFFPRVPRPMPRLFGDARYRILDKIDRFEMIEGVAPEARIVLVRRPDGAWVFSANTVAGIGDFWEALQSAGVQPVAEMQGREKLTLTARFESLWPDSLVQWKFLSVKGWQWITMLLIIVVGIVLDFMTRLVLSIVSRRVIRRQGGRATPETLRRTVRPFGLAVAAVFWLWAIRLLGLTDVALQVLVPAVKLFAMLALVWSAFRLTDLLGEVAASRATRTSTRFDDLLIPLLRKAMKVFIFVFGMIYIASALDVGIAPLLTGLGIGGAGFAFAAKDTLEHFFGSVTVIADRPFEVGDWVTIGDVEGTVEELGFRSTRIRTFYNSLVTVPNGNLVRAVVDNYGRRKYRRWSTHLNLTYDTPPDAMEAFCEGVREIIRVHPYTRKDYYQVWLHKFGPHSLDVLLYMFFEAPDWNTELRERHRLMLDIIRLADRLGVQFAFPTQTLHLHQESPDAEHVAHDAPDARAERRAHAIGRRAVRAITSAADWHDEKPPPHEILTCSPVEDDEETQIESKIGGSA